MAHGTRTRALDKTDLHSVREICGRIVKYAHFNHIPDTVPCIVRIFSTDSTYVLYVVATYTFCEAAQLLSQQKPNCCFSKQLGVAQFVFIPLAMMIAVTQPYKPHFSIYNAVDSILVPLMALWCASIVCIIMLAPEAQRWLIFVVLLFILSVLPLFYISFVILHWICCQRKVGQKMIGKIRGWIGRNTGRTITTDSDESLPDRLINPAEYEELTAPLAVQVEDKPN